MKTDYRFASSVAELAAEIIANGWPYGTFDDPDAELLPGVGVETACMRAAHHIWGGPGWWRKNMAKAEACLQTIRWAVLDATGGFQPGPAATLNEAHSRTKLETIARERWKSMSVGETVIMLLIASRWILNEKPKL